MASTLIRAARVVAARKNMEVINNHKHVEILSRRAKDGGLLSNVYLLPVEHRTELPKNNSAFDLFSSTVIRQLN
ncbi:hypothetical protein TSUD_52190 [Trifolium subterraneum]|uniref:Uncharacterized protein n=1 Tax=Trifolium subterraneum TaxID=3900 RepID=A0A2Z6M7D7_TRISU|nr:hypothetical protein TSUD_52190 [Trifolium subterraneum]